MPIYMQIKGIAGTSTKGQYAGWFEINSFSFGVADNTSESGTGGGAGKVSVSDITITKNQDVASPKFFLACCNGMHIPSVRLEWVSGGDHLYLQWILDNAIVTSWQQSSGGDRPSESLSLNFEKITIATYENGQLAEDAIFSTVTGVP